MQRQTVKKCNLILMICAMACLVYYDIAGGLWLKGVTSLWFCVLGAVNLIHARHTRSSQFKLAAVMETALVVGAAADVLLGIEFMVGVVFFALGHVIYMIAFFSMQKPEKKDLFFILPIAAIAAVVLAGIAVALVLKKKK